MTKILHESVKTRILYVTVLSIIIVVSFMLIGKSNACAASKYEAYTLEDGKTSIISGYEFKLDEHRLTVSKNGTKIDIPECSGNYTFDRILFNGKYLYFSISNNNTSTVYKYNLVKQECIYTSDTTHDEYYYLIRYENGHALYAKISNSSSSQSSHDEDSDYNYSHTVLIQEDSMSMKYGAVYYHYEDGNYIEGTYELFDVSKSGSYLYGKNDYKNFAGGGYPMYKLSIQNSNTGKTKVIKRTVYYKRTGSGLTYASLSKDKKTLNVYTSSLSGANARKAASISLGAEAPADISGFVERITSKYVYYDPNTYWTDGEFSSSSGKYAYRYNLETGKKTRYKLEDYKPASNNQLFKRLYVIGY